MTTSFTSLQGPEPKAVPTSLASVGMYKERYLRKLATSDAFKMVAREAAKSFAESRITKVACIETLGIPLGTAVAIELEVGLVLLRKCADGDSLPGFLTVPFRDYSHDVAPKIPDKYMRLLADSISAGDRVLIVDDHIDTGGQFEAACRLIRGAKGVVVGGVSEGLVNAARMEEIGFAVQKKGVSAIGGESEASRVWLLNAEQN